MQNAFAESFIRRLRDECLNEHLFMSLGESREKLEVWRRDCNELRPRSAIGSTSPIGLTNPNGVTGPPMAEKVQNSIAE